MKYSLIGLFFLLLLPFLISAQTNGSNAFTIRGTILDEQNKPIPFGNVVLYQSADSVLVKGTTTNEDGKF